LTSPDIETIVKQSDQNMAVTHQKVNKQKIRSI